MQNMNIDEMIILQKKLTEELEVSQSRIEELPKGSIVTRPNGTHQRTFRHGKGHKTVHIKSDELEIVKVEIEERHKLTEKIKVLNEEIKILEVLCDETKRMHQTYWNIMQFAKKYQMNDK